MPGEGEERLAVGADEQETLPTRAVGGLNDDSADDFDDDLDDWFYNTDEKGERWVFE